MEKPIFVVLRKYFHVAYDSIYPFCPDGGDILLYDNYDVAKQSALKWCRGMADDVVCLCDCGELSAEACQIDSLVLQCFGRFCKDCSFVRVEVEIYQKYVL